MIYDSLYKTVAKDTVVDMGSMCSTLEIILHVYETTRVLFSTIT